MSAVTDLLRDLIRIPSVNPEGEPGTERTGEGEIARFLAQRLKQEGAVTELREVLPGRPNIIARFPSNQPNKPKLLFAPHTDTVSVVGMTIDPFSGEARDGRIWGRGASDTKGTMAAMLVALFEMKDDLPNLSHEVWFAGLMSEEAGQHGSRALADEEKFDFVIVGEPTSLDIVYTHKGSTWLTLKTTGVSAHASMPEKGRNAIESMMEALSLLKREFPYLYGALQDPVLGMTTMNIGTIRGGSKVNIVPDRCEAAVDIRTLPGQEIETLVELVQANIPGIEITVNGSKPLYTYPGHPLVSRLRETGAKLIGAPWFCDAAPFSEKGVAAIALGPGSIVQAHTCDEWIAISDLEDGVRFFKKFLQQLILK
jgi:acetylornithine deacetylase/succinyl-diaminopimelate desuccinylase-like protein